MHAQCREKPEVRRLDELERKVGTQDHTIAQILAALRQLTQPASTPRRRIGFA